MFCLSRAVRPRRSVLCGPADAIARARDCGTASAWDASGRRARGGRIVAIETMVERLADDHARARRLADALADRFPGSVEPAAVETNVVCVRADALPGGRPAGSSSASARNGVRAGTIDARTVRLVTTRTSTTGPSTVRSTPRRARGRG